MKQKRTGEAVKAVHTIYMMRIVEHISAIWIWTKMNISGLYRIRIINVRITETEMSMR